MSKRKEILMFDCPRLCVTLVIIVSAHSKHHRQLTNCDFHCLFHSNDSEKQKKNLVPQFPQNLLEGGLIGTKE